MKAAHEKLEKSASLAAKKHENTVNDLNVANANLSQARAEMSAANDEVNDAMAARREAEKEAETASGKVWLFGLLAAVGWIAVAVMVSPADKKY